MSIDYQSLAVKGVQALSPYQPGKPIDELARELGLKPDNIIKLASNENPLGPSPKALAAVKVFPPAFAVLDMRLEDGTGLRVVEAMREARPDSKVIMLTGYGNIATAVAAVKAGAVDYLSKPADAADVARALLALPGDAPAPPENPMSADRVRWEHIQRVYELCGHYVSETARRLNMHRRTLQRILAKRAPR